MQEHILHLCLDIANGPVSSEKMLPGLKENVILTEIILTTSGTNEYVKGDTWCQRGVWHPNGAGLNQ